MPRNAAARSCSTTCSSPVAVSSACAGDVVPQNGQMSSFLAGFHCASPPHDGQENFFLAVASGINRGQRIVWQGNEDKQNFFPKIPPPIIPRQFRDGCEFNFCMI